MMFAVASVAGLVSPVPASMASSRCAFLRSGVDGFAAGGSQGSFLASMLMLEVAAVSMLARMSPVIVAVMMLAVMIAIVTMLPVVSLMVMVMSMLPCC